MTDDRLANIERLLGELLARLEQPPQEYLSVKHAAVLCDTSDDSIRRAIAGGHITAYRPARGSVTVRVDELRAWLQSTGEIKLRRGRGIR